MLIVLTMKIIQLQSCKETSLIVTSVIIRSITYYSHFLDAQEDKQNGDFVSGEIMVKVIGAKTPS